MIHVLIASEPADIVSRYIIPFNIQGIITLYQKNYTCVSQILVRSYCRRSYSKPYDVVASKLHNE